MPYPVNSSRFSLSSATQGTHLSLAGHLVLVEKDQNRHGRTLGSFRVLQLFLFLGGHCFLVMTQEQGGDSLWHLKHAVMGGFYCCCCCRCEFLFGWFLFLLFPKYPMNTFPAASL